MLRRALLPTVILACLVSPAAAQDEDDPFGKMFGEEDHSGAGGENRRAGSHPFDNSAGEVLRLHQAKHRQRFAARHDQCSNNGKLGRGAH